MQFGLQKFCPIEPIVAKLNLDSSRFGINRKSGTVAGERLLIVLGTLQRMFHSAMKVDDIPRHRTNLSRERTGGFGAN